MGDKFPKHIYHSIICIGALVATQDNDSWRVDALGAPSVATRSEKELISSFVERIAELKPQLVTFNVTVPLCRGHHRQLHQAGNEQAWWENLRINALEVARGFWVQTHRALATKPAHQGGNEHAKS
jgi:Predicted 3'-5' exonuclease related to the exonuclease domain of PolB